MKKRKNRIKSKNSKYFLYLLGFFIFLLGAIFFLQLDLELKLNKEVKSFTITDSCGVIAGDLMHEFSTEGDCKLRCSNLCGVRDLEYISHNFISENRTCYLCNCNCK